MSTLTNSILSTSPFPIAHHRIVTDNNGQPVDCEILEVNPAFEELIGLPAGKLTGKRASEVLPDAALFNPDRLHLFGKAAMEGTHASFEYRAKSGKRWFKVQVWQDGQGCFATLHTDISDKKILEKKHEERSKELNVVYNMAHISEREDATVESICQTIADHFPGAFQDPEVTCCRITIGDREYLSANYSDAGVTIDRHISVPGKIAGSITVGYLGKLNDDDDGPFLQEEKQLLGVVADWTGQFIHRSSIRLWIRPSAIMPLSGGTGSQKPFKIVPNAAFRMTRSWRSSPRRATGAGCALRVRPSEMALSSEPDVLLMDIHLADKMDGIDAVGVIHQEKPIPVIFITAYDEASVVERAMKHNPLAYLKKPVNPNEIERVLRESF